MSCWHLCRICLQSHFEEVEHYVSYERLFDSLFIKPALTTSKCLDGNLADGYTIGTSLMKPVIKGTPMPTPTPTPRPWAWLTLRWLIMEGFPILVQWPRFNFHILNNRFGVNWVDFSILPQYLFYNNARCDGETLFNLSTSFNLFLLLLIKHGRALCM